MTSKEPFVRSSRKVGVQVAPAIAGPLISSRILRMILSDSSTAATSRPCGGSLSLACSCSDRERWACSNWIDC